MSMCTALAIVAVFLFIYMVPCIIAYEGLKRQRVSITVLNVLLGWTFVGWVVALVWATMKDKGQ